MPAAVVDEARDLCGRLGLHARDDVCVPLSVSPRLQEWMGHADIQTTMKYLHYARRQEAAPLGPEECERVPADPVWGQPTVPSRL